MRILLLAPELFTTDSGIPRMLRLYLKALCDLAGERGGQVDFVALNDVVVDTTELRPYSGPAFRRWSVCGRDKVRFIRESLRLGREADLIVCGHVGQLPVAWLARLLHRRIRYVLVAHGIEVWRPFTFWQRRALAGAERILCVSEFTRGELRRRTGLDAERFVVVPNALDPQLAPPAPPAPLPAEPVILAVARLARSDAYKGIDHLIAAMPAIRAAEPRARLRIVGRGDDRDRLYQLARQLKVLEAVEFAGFVPNEQLHGEFERCRLFALPSQREGFGLVYVEAMAHGRPCLGARDGGTTEVITPETGVLVTYGDAPALAAAAVAALRRAWAPEPILARAEHFSYSQFRTRLASLLPW
ncbi:MAG: glycosyltransferase family 4 protein [Verrucomicrobia bacterium]|nr:glycosyltransferase family 4 protein [Verrucomicrobiota bacterium]